MIFTRRKNNVKKAKDLYYIFDILTGGARLRPMIMDEFKKFAKTHSPYLNKLV